MPNIIRMIGTKITSWYAAHMGKKRNACRVLAVKPNGKTLGKPRYKWKDIKIDLR
jgi:hypothetical protein